MGNEKIACDISDKYKDGVVDFNEMTSEFSELLDAKDTELIELKAGRDRLKAKVHMLFTWMPQGTGQAELTTLKARLEEADRYIEKYTVAKKEIFMVEAEEEITTLKAQLAEADQERKHWFLRLKKADTKNTALLAVVEAARKVINYKMKYDNPDPKEVREMKQEWEPDKLAFFDALKRLDEQDTEVEPGGGESGK